MQITEQIIERIARRTFNSMFAPALRQSNVVTSGSGSSVSWADNAGHANSADTATTADSATTAASASAAPWAGITDKPATATRWPAWSEVTDKPSTFAPSSGSSYYLTRDAWWNVSDAHDANELRSGVVFAYDASHHSNTATTGTLVAFSCRSNDTYTLQLQGQYGGENLYFRNRNGDNGTWQAWRSIIHSGNISSQSVNYATSAGSATKATQDGDGNTISSTYLKLSGGTLTGNLTVNPANANDSRIGVTNTNALGTSIYLLASTNRGVYHSTAGWLVATDGTNSFMDIGRVGIGTHEPGAKLGVAGGADMWTGYFNGNSQSAAYLAYSGGQGAYICSKKNDTTYLFALYKNQTSLGSGGDVVMYAQCDGNVGIGTSSPSQKLHVSGGLAAITNNSRTVTIGAQNNGAIHIYNDNNSGTYFNGIVSSNGNGAYDLGTSTYPWKKLYAQGCEIYATSPSVHVGTSSSARISLHWSSDSNRGLYDYTGYWVVGTNGTNTFMSKGNVGIGTSSPQYKLHVVGTIYATASVAQFSDIRGKNVETYDWAPSLETIANAPIIRYTKKDGSDTRKYIGSVAQYWHEATPEAVMEADDGMLSMDYGTIALVNVVALAREVRQLKAQIAQLKRH